MIYLDNAATTQTSFEVMRILSGYISESYANPGSIHQMGRDAEAAITKARRTLAKTINADVGQIIFTSCATEANNMVLLGLEKHLKKQKKKHIIVSSVEHPSVMNPAKELERRGFEVTYLPVNQYGQIDMRDLYNTIRDDTGLVSVMCVNNEIGTFYDPELIGSICHKKGVLFHTDCVQAYGLVPLDVKKCHIDFLTVSGHKIYAPKGVGFLFAKKRELLTPLVYGGGQESGSRSGTENVPGIVGLAAAASMVADARGATREANRRLHAAITQRLEAEFGDTFKINGIPENTLRILNIRFDGVDGESLVLLLSKRGVMVSAGSACSSHSVEPSHVLKAIGLTDEEAKSSIRISLSYFTTMAEVKKAVDIIIDCVKTLRGE